MIIGITGLKGAGKTTVVEYLEKKGFNRHSLSDIIRELLQKEEKTITRENLIMKGNALRSEYGNGVLAERALQKIHDDTITVIDSIHHPGEVDVLKTRKDFVLMAVEAPTEVRLERLIERQRDKELSYEEIAKSLKISVQAVKSRIFRAREEMRKHLMEYFKERL